MQSPITNPIQDQILNLFDNFPSLESFLGANKNAETFIIISEKIKELQKSLFFSHFLKSEVYLQHPSLEKIQSELFFNLLENKNNCDFCPLHLYIRSFISTLPPMNNVGDPYEKNDPSAKKRFLLELIDFFASKTGLKKTNKKLNFLTGEESNEYWGYLANRKNATIVWASKQAKKFHLNAQEYFLQDPKEFIIDNFILLKEKGLIFFLSSVYKLDDVQTFLNILKENGFHDYYIHWEIKILKSELNHYINIPDEINSLTINMQALFSTDTYCELLLYRKNGGEVKGEYISVLNQADKTIECSLNGHSALEIWFYLRTEFTETDDLPVFNEDAILLEIQGIVETLKSTNDGNVLYVKLEELHQWIYFSLLPKAQQRNIQLMKPILIELKMICSYFFSYFMGGPSYCEMSIVFQIYRILLSKIKPIFLTNFQEADSTLFEIKKKVINFFGSRHKILEPWGYISSGGTESNEWAILQAHSRFPTSKLFFSDCSHYCLEKAAKNHKIPYEKISSNEDDTIDLNHLKQKLIENTCAKVPPIILLNIGTTHKGTMDDLASVHEILKELNIKEFFIHLDGALLAEVFPEKSNYLNTPFDTISFSLHKWLGLHRIGSVLICDSKRNPLKIEPLNEVMDGKLLMELNLCIENDFERFNEIRKNEIFELSSYFIERLKILLKDKNDILTWKESFYFYFKNVFKVPMWIFSHVDDQYSRVNLMPTNKNRVEAFLEDLENLAKLKKNL